MYANDEAIFIYPLNKDLEATTTILHKFGKNSILHINLQKSSVHLIKCQDINLYHVLASFTWAKRIHPVPLSGATTTYKILAEGRTTLHRAHQLEAIMLER